MKLSVITDEISQDFEHALAVMREYDVPAAELRGLWGVNIGDLSPEHVKRAQRALRDQEMVVSCLATPVLKCELDTEDATVAGRMHLARARSSAEQTELLRRCAGLAHQFGTDLIRIFTFWRRAEMTPAIEARIVDAVADLAETAAHEGVTLVLENEHACYVGTGAEAARVITAVDSPQLKACWDPGNAFAAGERPYPDGYEAIRPHLAHVHVKDAVATSTGDIRWTVIGEGQLDYPAQLEALRRDGYQGFVSLETHYVPQDGTPEEGSRPCLAALRRLI